MLRNEPLLFVKGPPVFIKVVVKNEESTSVFVGNEDGSGVVSEAGQVVQRRQEVLEVRKNRKLLKWQIHQFRGKSIILQHHLLDKSIDLYSLF